MAQICKSEAPPSPSLINTEDLKLPSVQSCVEQFAHPKSTLIAALEKRNATVEFTGIQVGIDSIANSTIEFAATLLLDLYELLVNKSAERFDYINFGAQVAAVVGGPKMQLAGATAVVAVAFERLFKGIPAKLSPTYANRLRDLTANYITLRMPFELGVRLAKSHIPPPVNLTGEFNPLSLSAAGETLLNLERGSVVTLVGGPGSGKTSAIGTALETASSNSFTQMVSFFRDQELKALSESNQGQAVAEKIGRQLHVLLRRTLKLDSASGDLPLEQLIPQLRELQSRLPTRVFLGIDDIAQEFPHPVKRLISELSEMENVRLILGAHPVEGRIVTKGITASANRIIWMPLPEKQVLEAYWSLLTLGTTAENTVSQSTISSIFNFLGPQARLANKVIREALEAPSATSVDDTINRLQTSLNRFGTASKASVSKDRFAADLFAVAEKNFETALMFSISAEGRAVLAKYLRNQVSHGDLKFSATATEIRSLMPLLRGGYLKLTRTNNSVRVEPGSVLFDLYLRRQKF